MKTIYWIALILLVVGGLNWALVGLFGLDLVAYLFGSMSLIAKVVYIVVGVSALIVLFSNFKCCKKK